MTETTRVKRVARTVRKRKNKSPATVTYEGGTRHRESVPRGVQVRISQAGVWRRHFTGDEYLLLGNPPTIYIKAFASTSSRQYEGYLVTSEHRP